MPALTTNLLSRCAAAATATETAFRIDAPITPTRGARVIALDAPAAAVAGRIAAQPWASARFFVCTTEGSRVVLTGIGGPPADLAEQLVDADVVVMIAAEDSGAAAASMIGRACSERGIMTAGLVLGDSSLSYAVHGSVAEHAVAALRPHARVLLPSADETDVAELLAALRA